MRIRVWNAYASNNSGSYTIVGNFRTEEEAAALAEELRRVCVEHGEWLGQQSGLQPPGPLGKYAKAQGLARHENDGIGDDWPDNSGDDHPEVCQVGTQVLVHSDWTITLPPFFGALFYARGGSVSSVIDHAHAPVVAQCQVYYPYDRKRREERSLEPVLAALRAEDGVFARHTWAKSPPAWQLDPWGKTMRVAIVFDDLVEGARALQQTATEHGASVHFQMIEALDGNDPAGHMRPCSPPDESRPLRVLVTDLGPDRQAVRAILDRLNPMRRDKQPAHPNAPIDVFGRPIYELRARFEAKRLTDAGATVVLAEQE